jgi:hypothetical protein
MKGGEESLNRPKERGDVGSIEPTYLNGRHGSGGASGATSQLTYKWLIK